MLNQSVGVLLQAGRSLLGRERCELVNRQSPHHPRRFDVLRVGTRPVKRLAELLGSCWRHQALHRQCHCHAGCDRLRALVADLVT